MNSVAAETSSPTMAPTVVVEEDDIIDTEEDTPFEFWFSIALGLAFVVIAIVAFRRIRLSNNSTQPQQQAGAETTVVTAFYSLIFATSVLRAIWALLLIPLSSDLSHATPYLPIAVYAFDDQQPEWLMAFLSELFLTCGSLTLFSIFILILVYWADILKKYFHPGSRRMLPMVLFMGIVSFLVVVELVNVILFLSDVYTTEGLVLYNAILLGLVSTICVIQITIFSHRFRTVLKTLGAINQVSTDAQVKRIVWITVTGNLFFFTRALLEGFFAISLIVFWSETGTVAKTFSHATWDTYAVLTYMCEVAILSLMLYILQTRFTSAARAAAQGVGSYTEVPDAEPVAEPAGTTNLVV